MSKISRGLGAATLAVALASPALAELDDVSWDMQSTYPGSLTQLGTLGKEIEARLSAVSDGQIQVKFQEPGAIVPALEAFDAVSSGAVQAGWSTPMPDEDWTSGQQGLLQSVAEHVVEGGDSDVDGALGLEVVRVIYSAYRSAVEGRRVTIG